MLVTKDMKWVVKAGLWIEGTDPPLLQPDCPGWNDIDNERIAQQMNNLVQSVVRWQRCD